MATRAETVASVEGILTDANHPHFMAALKWASENGYGRPTQTMASQTAEPMRIRATYDKLPEWKSRRMLDGPAQGHSP